MGLKVPMRPHPTDDATGKSLRQVRWSSLMAGIALFVGTAGLGQCLGLQSFMPC